MPTKEASARILIADDHSLFRHGLASLINGQPDLVIVMDINMPISDGLEATRLIRKYVPETKIMMLTIRDEDETLFEAVKAGAGGYMLKNADADAFVEGIRQMLAGDAVLPPTLAARLLNEFARLANQPAVPAATRRKFGLSKRELEILTHIGAGETDKEIARKLTLSVYTIKSHVRNILAKLHAANRWEAANKAREEGLLPD
jgi:DNA-binding NarL/FixJ family response regulator